MPLYRSTGRKVSLLGAVSEWADLVRKVNGHSLSDVGDKFVGSIATVKCTDLGVAVEEFIESRRRKTEAKDGKRPKLSPEHH